MQVVLMGVEYLGEFIDLPAGGKIEKKRLVELKHFDHEPTWKEIQEQMKSAHRCKFVQLRGKNNGGLPRLRNWENPHFTEINNNTVTHLNSTTSAPAQSNPVSRIQPSATKKARRMAGCEFRIRIEFLEDVFKWKYGVMRAQAALARRLGVTDRYLRYLKACRRTPSGELFLKINRLYRYYSKRYYAELYHKHIFEEIDGAPFCLVCGGELRHG